MSPYLPHMLNMISSNSINLASYSLLDGSVFIKDRMGRYLWANSFFINCSAGHNSLGEITYKRDNDFPWHEYADELRANDKAVFEAKQGQSHYEQIVRYDGTFVNILTRKSPLAAQNGELIGLIGMSIALPSTQGIAKLTKRERECVSFLAKGYSTKKIAKQLTLSPRTVETHLQQAKDKTSVATRAELIALFCRFVPYC
ncbi:DNA-binding transcriptional activator UhpA [Legionella massiliensis]|uniref:DNA-binding transcriptional activator UhpA n=1 Tax=Legionella massiliensis TaxID=1034943 RepID=A0A078L0Z9_9GAMM|nr:PAS and helix-turn-helix domain-containing protein [Legionella massiliensis]CDZ77733.1 DNA-binding transcriptional activator UhpA [Legionella massiliensis]CEE13471.1 Putative HTH-type transcriptional regulator/MT0914 [Legionella massiliensis]